MNLLKPTLMNPERVPKNPPQARKSSNSTQFPPGIQYACTSEEIQCSHSPHLAVCDSAALTNKAPILSRCLVCDSAEIAQVTDIEWNPCNT